MYSLNPPARRISALEIFYLLALVGTSSPC